MKTVRCYWKRIAIIICCLIICVWFVYNHVYKKNVKNSFKNVFHRRLPNPGYVTYLINNKHVCHDYRSVFCIIIVNSVVTNVNRRLELRSTWLKSNNYKPKNVQVIYLTGKINDKNVQNKLMLESQTYSDIIQEDFIDSYQNSTYKGVLGFKWVAEHCMNAEIVIKINDNAVINLFLFFEKFAMHMNDREVFGNQMGFSEIIRRHGNKYYLPFQYLKGMIHYPLPYLSGVAVILPVNLIPLYVNASMTTDYFPIEDYFLFGILTDKINRGLNDTSQIMYRDLNKFITSDEMKWITCYRFSKKNCNLLVVFNEVYRLDTETVWNAIIKDRTQNANGHFDME